MEAQLNDLCRQLATNGRPGSIRQKTRRLVPAMLISPACDVEMIQCSLVEVGKG